MIRDLRAQDGSVAAVSTTQVMPDSHGSIENLFYSFIRKHSFAATLLGKNGVDLLAAGSSSDRELNEVAVKKREGWPPLSKTSRT